MRKPRFVEALGVLILVTGSSAALAQNLIPDPRFDTGVSAWQLVATAPAAALVWDKTRDLYGSPSGGSAQLYESALDPGLSATICLPVTAGRIYSSGVSFLFPAGQPSREIYPRFEFFAGAGCTGAVVGASGGPVVFSDGVNPETWVPVADPDVTAPAGAASVNFVMQYSSVVGLGPAAVNFDNVYFGPQGTAPPAPVASIPALSRAAVLGLMAALAFVAFRILGRG